MIIVALSGLAWLVMLFSTVPHCTPSPYGECRSNLKSWYTAQRVLQAEHDVFSPEMGRDGFTIRENNRYLYAWARDGRFAYPRSDLTGVRGLLPAWERRSIPRSAIPETVSGVRVGVWPTVATAVCLAQLDDDDDYEIWSVSTLPRSDALGREIPAGEPRQFHADLP